MLNKLVAMLSVVAIVAFASPAVFAYGGAIVLGGGGGYSSGPAKKSAVKAAVVEKVVTTEEKAAEAPKVVLSTAAQKAAAATPFVDVKQHWAVEHVEKLRAKGVVSGKSATAFAPDATITRAELVKIAVNAFGHSVDEAAVSPFGDVSKDDWSRKYVAAAKKAGFVGGYEDGTFKPNGAVNRAEALKILLAAAGKTVSSAPKANFPDVVQAAWYAKYVNWAADKGIVKGYSNGKFGVDGSMTRAEISKVAAMLLDM